MQKKANLSSILDKLWQQPGERSRLASELVKELTDDDWLILGGWDFAATFGPVSGRLGLVRPRHIQVSDDWGRVFLTASLAQGSDLGDYFLLIRYRGSNLAVASHERHPGGQTEISRDPAALLVALQLLRDHLDSALLSPKKLRDNKISNFAVLCGLENDHFRRLAIWLSATASYL